MAMLYEGEKTLQCKSVLVKYLFDMKNKKSCS